MNQRFIVIGIIILVVIGLGVGSWFYLSTKQRGTVSEEVQQKSEPETLKELSTIEKITARSFAEKALKLLQNRDYGKIYDLLTEEDKAKISRSDYIKQRVGEEQGSTITNWEIKEILEEKDGASIQYVIEVDSPLFGVITASNFLNLVKRDGKWLLSRDTSSPTTVGIIEDGIGVPVEFSTIKITVNSIAEKQALTRKYFEPTEAKEGAKFLVIDMDITNITNTSFTLYPEDGFKIIDDKGREFVKTNSNIDNSLDYRELTPSIKENGLLAYEVPQDAMSYKLVVKKAGTNEVIEVILR